MTSKKARSEAGRIMGQAGGKRGGIARAKSLTPKRRRQIARKANRIGLAKRRLAAGTATEQDVKILKDLEDTPGPRCRMAS
jgi:hypothetical protein